MSNDSAAAPLHGVVLLPCPFCGGNARIEEGFDVDCESTTATIYCEGCEAMFGPEYPDDIEDVVEFMGRWNNRVDREDAETYRAWKRGFAAAHKASLGKDCGVWDSRNVGQ